jgi:hypothetical protein
VRQAAVEEERIAFLQDARLAADGQFKLAR